MPAGCIFVLFRPGIEEMFRERLRESGIIHLRPDGEETLRCISEKQAKTNQKSTAQKDVPGRKKLKRRQKQTDELSGCGCLRGKARTSLEPEDAFPGKRGFPEKIRLHSLRQFAIIAVRDISN